MEIKICWHIFEIIQQSSFSGILAFSFYIIGHNSWKFLLGFYVDGDVSFRPASSVSTRIWWVICVGGCSSTLTYFGSVTIRRKNNLKIQIGNMVVQVLRLLRGGFWFVPNATKGASPIFCL